MNKNIQQTNVEADVAVHVNAQARAMQAPYRRVAAMARIASGMPLTDSEMREFPELAAAYVCPQPPPIPAPVAREAAKPKVIDDVAYMVDHSTNALRGWNIRPLRQV